VADIRALGECKRLHNVSLYANLLSSLEACTDTLLGLPALEELDLGNNPCAFAEEYRHLLCLSFPQLTKLDGDSVTVLDRDLAHHYYEGKGVAPGERPGTAAPPSLETDMRERGEAGTQGSQGGAAQVLVIHGDGSPPGHKARAEDWGGWGDEEEAAHEAAEGGGSDEGSSRQGSRPGTAGGTILYQDQELNEHPILLQYLAESSLEEANKGSPHGGGAGSRKPRKVRSFVDRLRKTAQVMEQTKSLDPAALAGVGAQNQLQPSPGAGGGSIAVPPEMTSRPGTAAVLDDVLGRRGALLRVAQGGSAGQGNHGGGWNEAEPRETIRQLLRVVGDLRAENRELRQAQKRADQAAPYLEGSQAGGSMQLEQLEAENANMYHLLRQNRELKSQVKSMEALLEAGGGGQQGAYRSRDTGPLFELGEAVEADFRGEGEYYCGEIVFDHGNECFDVSYDDGDHEKQVPARRIRKLDQPDETEQRAPREAAAETEALAEATNHFPSPPKCAEYGPMHHRSGEPKIRDTPLAAASAQ